MAADCGFHPEALSEYAEAASHYLREASPRVAEAFVAAVESAIADFSTAPTRWRVIDAPDIRRYVFNRFPYVIYYRWESAEARVTICRHAHEQRARLLAPPLAVRFNLEAAPLRNLGESFGRDALRSVRGCS